MIFKAIRIQLLWARPYPQCYFLLIKRNKPVRKKSWIISSLYNNATPLKFKLEGHLNRSDINNFHKKIMLKKRQKNEPFCLIQIVNFYAKNMNQLNQKRFSMGWIRSTSLFSGYVIYLLIGAWIFRKGLKKILFVRLCLKNFENFKKHLWLRKSSGFLKYFLNLNTERSNIHMKRKNVKWARIRKIICHILYVT